MPGEKKISRVNRVLCAEVYVPKNGTLAAAATLMGGGDHMQRVIFAFFMLAILGVGAACNTVRGVGQDVERAGEKTQDAAESVRRRL
jgi:predicted small secreted protein